MIEKRISILGGGWLGQPLAKSLEEKGYKVKVSTASTSNYKRLKGLGLEAFQLSVHHNELIGDFENFLKAEVLIINIPPDRTALGKVQFASFFSVLERSFVKKVVFISATSVYPICNRMVTEEEDLRDRIHHLLLSERLFLSSSSFETTIVRMAGLIGNKRHPGRFFAHSLRIKNSAAPVNLIHLEDAILVIEKILEQEKWGEIFNACCDDHSIKATFYPAAATAIGLEMPTCEQLPEPSFNLMSNEKVKNVLGITFKYNNLMKLIQPQNWR